MKIKQIIKKVTLSLAAVAVVVAGALAPVAVHADDEAANTSGLSMSPMYEKVVLNPGEKYTSTFRIRNPYNASGPFYYKIYNQPYFRDENNNAIFTDVEGRSQIVDWITIVDGNTGVLGVGEARDVVFEIDVPEDAPAGGQYVAITVSSDDSQSPTTETGAIMVQEVVALGYTVYAEVTGETIHQGEITDAGVSGFLFSGDISGHATIKNTGNTHGTATYTLQVFPLFSGEEVYTNEEDPETRLVLPDRTLYNETAWENTPWFGVFNVLYTVEFEGVVTQVSKLVIVCPVWLLFVIIFAIIALIIWIALHVHSRGKFPKKDKESEE